MRDRIQDAARYAIECRISMDEFKRLAAEAMITEALNMRSGNQCKAAGMIKVHRNTLGRIYREKQVSSIGREAR